MGFGMERRGLAITTLGAQVAREVVVADGGARMVIAQDAAANVQGLDKERLGIGVAALGVQV